MMDEATRFEVADECLAGMGYTTGAWGVARRYREYVEARQELGLLWRPAPTTSACPPPPIPGGGPPPPKGPPPPPRQSKRGLATAFCCASAERLAAAHWVAASGFDMRQRWTTSICASSRAEASEMDAAHVMEEGVIVRNGGAELVNEINEKGFGSLKDD